MSKSHVSEGMEPKEHELIMVNQMEVEIEALDNVSVISGYSGTTASRIAIDVDSENAIFSLTIAK